MNAFRRHWYSLGLIPAAVMAAWLAWNWNDIVWVQKLLALNFIVLILHQFEEYAWPGGFPWICNEVLTPKPGGPPDRYPLNQNNAAFINVFGWLFYLVPVLLPRVIWLGFGQMLFGLVGQVIVHGVIINSKLKTWYNPGLVAVMLGHVPLAILYFMEVFSRGAVSMVGLGLRDPLSRLLRRRDHAAHRPWWPTRQSEFSLPVCDGRNEPE